MKVLWHTRINFGEFLNLFVGFEDFFSVDFGDSHSILHAGKKLKIFLLNFCRLNFHHTRAHQNINFVIFIITKKRATNFLFVICFHLHF